MMCTVSFVGDLWTQTVPRTHPWVEAYPWNDGPTRAEFEALKRDVESLRDALMAAKQYDEITGQPDCEMEEKVALIRRVAEIVGVDLSDVLGEPTQ